MNNLAHCIIENPKPSSPFFNMWKLATINKKCSMNLVHEQANHCLMIFFLKSIPT
jgi:hypothetical protein